MQQIPSEEAGSWVIWDSQSRRVKSIGYDAMLIIKWLPTVVTDTDDEGSTVILWNADKYCISHVTKYHTW
jgi:hypothetical protein